MDKVVAKLGGDELYAKIVVRKAEVTVWGFNVLAALAKALVKHKIRSDAFFSRFFVLCVEVMAEFNHPCKAHAVAIMIQLP
jgi:hypothetical protein